MSFLSFERMAAFVFTDFLVWQKTFETPKLLSGWNKFQESFVENEVHIIKRVNGKRSDEEFVSITS